MLTLRSRVRWPVRTASNFAPAALAFAEQIATRAPLSVEATKECANRSFNLSIAEALALQREQFLRNISTRDHGEALQAFIEKRPATFERR